MKKNLHHSNQQKFTIKNQSDEIPEYLPVVFSIREHLERLFNTEQSWNSLKFLSGDLKKLSERLIQLILWSEPRISDASINKWNTTNTGFASCILLLKLYNCKPLRLHLRLEDAGKNKVEFWT